VRPARLLPLALAGAFFAVLLAITVVRDSPRASALPPLGTDTIGVKATINVATRAGAETFPLSGTVTIVRQAPHSDAGVQVEDAEITSMTLNGFSLAGDVTVSESDSQTSTGEVRSQQSGSEFPASSFFDLYSTVSAPNSPTGAITVHNPTALRFTAVDDITSWPPYGVRFQLVTPYHVDDDHDGMVDEDGSDDDNDGLYDEDRFGPDPDTPGFGYECIDDADCDHVEGEDPPIDLCPPAIAGQHTTCDNDSDGHSDEDPSCIPLFNEGGTSLPLGVCLREASITLLAPNEVTPIPSFTQEVTPTWTPRTRTPTPTRTPTLTPTSTATPVPRGDADCSGVTNAIDSALILQFTAGLIKTLPCQAAADANHDGSVNAIDSALILQFVAGLLQSLPP
jgi:hypothetical protein